MKLGIIGLAALIATPAWASTPSAWSSEAAAAASACIAAADLSNAVASAPIAFSDVHAIDVVLINGRSKAAHMRHAATTVVCLYSRKMKTAEVQEARSWKAPVVRNR